MFTVRLYQEEDAAACRDRFYEGFFACSVDQGCCVIMPRS